MRFRRSDYLGRRRVPLADSVRALVAERLGAPPDGPIRLLTQLRTLGHCFNPVSFYYCYDESERLRALVAEVTNTPWGERHAYVIGAGAERIIQGGMDKALHVSPFMEMDQRYEVRATPTRRDAVRPHLVAPGGRARVRRDARAASDAS